MTVRWTSLLTQLSSRDSDPAAMSRRTALKGGAAVAAATAVVRPVSASAGVPAQSAAGSGPIAVLPADIELVDIARIGGRHIAIGRSDAGASVWRVDNPTALQQIRLDAAVFDAADMTAVAADGSRLVAVGLRRVMQAVPVSGQSVPDAVTLPVATAWQSLDAGLSWARLDVPAPVPSRFDAVAINSAGVIVVGGAVLDADGVEGLRPLLVSSVDGRSWTNAPTDLEQLNEGSIVSICQTPDGWFAVGCSGVNGFVLRSSDSARWSVASLDSSPMDGELPHSVDFVADRGVAVVSSVNRDGDLTVRELDRRSGNPTATRRQAGGLAGLSRVRRMAPADDSGSRFIAVGVADGRSVVEYVDAR